MHPPHSVALSALILAHSLSPHHQLHSHKLLILSLFFHPQPVYLSTSPPNTHREKKKKKFRKKNGSEAQDQEHVHHWTRIAVDSDGEEAAEGRHECRPPSNPIPYPSSHHQNPHRLRQSLSLPDPNPSPFGIIVYRSTPDSNTKSDPPFSSSLSSNLATRLPDRTEKIHLAFSRSVSLPLTMADSGFSPSQGERGGRRGVSGVTSRNWTRCRLSSRVLNDRLYVG
ncbi:hypothetical protein ACFX13_022652 [Malus domestica]